MEREIYKREAYILAIRDRLGNIEHYGTAFNCEHEMNRQALELQMMLPEDKAVLVVKVPVELKTIPGDVLRDYRAGCEANAISMERIMQESQKLT